ncbi:hypothetical protein RRG08_055318 [Elysia crispata]|uniref:Uncharacterized protein n=1 Tax=Elysia crispata TaxID=231223 RepID=A0AAE1ARL7_9GAST|nr:hypothetical protein RRG08_055318 [Elysia crispata]
MIGEGWGGGLEGRPLVTGWTPHLFKLSRQREDNIAALVQFAVNRATVGHGRLPPGTRFEPRQPRHGCNRLPAGQLTAISDAVGKSQTGSASGQID